MSIPISRAIRAVHGQRVVETTLFVSAGRHLVTTNFAQYRASLIWPAPERQGPTRFPRLAG